jgi:hypothetical protein
MPFRICKFKSGDPAQWPLAASRRPGKSWKWPAVAPADARRATLAWFYCRPVSNVAQRAGGLTLDEARMAMNFAKLPELLRRDEKAPP